MALGGGTFTSQNKVLPGSYINFVSAKKAGATLSDRGIVALGLELDWGVGGEIVTVTADEFIKSSLKLFGYNYNHDKMRPLREVFLNAKTVHLYKLNSGDAKASNRYAEAKFGGVRGSDIKIVIKKSIDSLSMFDVSTLLEGTLVDKQTVSGIKDLKANDFVVWKSGQELEETVGMPLENGTNGSVEGQAHKNFLDKLESYYVNVLCCNSADSATRKLYAAYTKRMRDEVGVKFQTVIYDEAANHEGVINVKNRIKTSEGEPEHGIVFWASGIAASCSISKSNLNKVYNGEYLVVVESSQAKLEESIKNGEFVLHRVNDNIRVLEDVNSLVSLSDEKGEEFKYNQTVRVLDQIATDIAAMFSGKYLGEIPNDEAGRVSLWTDLVKHHEELEAVQAIENFSGEDIKISKGSQRNSVVVSDSVQIVGTMAKLYMTVMVM